MKKEELIKAFVENQFAYCPLVWMFHNRNVNSKINNLHERALKLMYNDDVSFMELLERAGEYTIHQRNIQFLAIEMFKVKNDTGPILLKDIFIERDYNALNLRKVPDFMTPKVNTVHYGENSLKAFGSRILNLIPNDIKYVNDIDAFKRRIRRWAPAICLCRLCKQYIQGVGYI